MQDSNNQAQFAKDMYQVPAHQGEVIDTPEISDETVNRTFADIARHETQIAFDKISKELAMVASGTEIPKEVQVETIETHPQAVELLQIGNGVKAMRNKRHAELVEIQTKRGIAVRIIAPLLGSNTFDSKKAKLSKEALLHDLIEEESKVGATIFPSDSQVTSRKFFLLPSDNYDEWFHQQTSPVREKDFTNSYTVTRYGIQKSSTYFDTKEARVKNISVIPESDEIKNLTLAATQYHEHISKKVYEKPSSLRRRLGL
jgi:hypothetical protein